MCLFIQKFSSTELKKKKKSAYAGWQPSLPASPYQAQYWLFREGEPVPGRQWGQ